MAKDNKKLDQLKQEIDNLAEKAKSPENEASKKHLSKINGALGRVNEQIELAELYKDKEEGLIIAAKALSTEASNSRKNEGVENNLLTRMYNANILTNEGHGQFDELFEHVSSKHAESKKARTAARKAEYEASEGQSLSNSSPRSEESAHSASHERSSPESNTANDPTLVTEQEAGEVVDPGEVKLTYKPEKETEQPKKGSTEFEPEERQFEKLSNLAKKIEASPHKEKEILEQEKENYQKAAKQAAAELNSRDDIAEQAKPKAEKTKQDSLHNQNIRNHLSNDKEVRENQIEFLANKNSESVIKQQEEALGANMEESQKQKDFKNSFRKLFCRGNTQEQSAKIDQENMPLNSKIEGLKLVTGENKNIDGQIYSNANRSKNEQASRKADHSKETGWSEAIKEKRGKENPTNKGLG